VTIHITAVGVCIAFTLVFGVLLLLNAFLEWTKPYLSEWIRWRNVAINAVLGTAFLLIGWLAI
jgi:hypothetical protein